MRLSLLLLACLLLVGCGPTGPKTYPVSGTVMFNGEPLAKGQISFMPKDGKTAPTGGAITAGKYTVQALEGMKSVEITATREEGPVDPVMGKARQKQYIPEKFNVSTTLEANVTPAGPNTFDFKLDDK